MRETLESLKQLGFSEYEARAYIALLQHGDVTGYELAKVSGIPRPNIYTVLQKLEQRGAAIRIDSPDANRYAPVPVEEVLERIDRDLHAAVRSARRGLKQLARPVEQSSVWNLREYASLLEHARTLLAGAEQALLIAVYPEEARALADSIAGAEANGVTLTTLCMAACAEPCSGCRGHLFRYQPPVQQESRWLLVVPDGQEVLAGEIRSAGEALAIRTRQPLLVNLNSWFIRHSIAVSALVNDLGEQIDGMLSPEAREALQVVGPVERPDNWLTYMRQLMHR